MIYQTIPLQNLFLKNYIATLLLGVPGYGSY